MANFRPPLDPRERSSPFAPRSSTRMDGDPCSTIAAEVRRSRASSKVGSTGACGRERVMTDEHAMMDEWEDDNEEKGKWM